MIELDEKMLTSPFVPWMLVFGRVLQLWNQMYHTAEMSPEHCHPYPVVSTHSINRSTQFFYYLCLPKRRNYRSLISWLWSDQTCPKKMIRGSSQKPRTLLSMNKTICTTKNTINYIFKPDLIAWGFVFVIRLCSF